MIGRFSKLGNYTELLQFKDFTRCLLGGGLALTGYLLNTFTTAPTWFVIVLFLLSIALNGLPIIYEAGKGILNKQVNVDELVSIAILASIFKGDLLTAAVVSVIMNLGALIEEMSSNSARKSIQTLAEIAPETATILDQSGERIVAVEEVEIGRLGRQNFLTHLYQ